MTSETFCFKIADATASFFNVNVIKIKHHRFKACKGFDLEFESLKIDLNLPVIPLLDIKRG